MVKLGQESIQLVVIYAVSGLKMPLFSFKSKKSEPVPKQEPLAERPGVQQVVLAWGLVQIFWI